MILATGGLWDVVEYKQAINGVIDLRDSFEEKRKYFCVWQLQQVVAPIIVEIIGMLKMVKDSTLFLGTTEKSVPPRHQSK